jgi:hypothetical protein
MTEGLKFRLTRDEIKGHLIDRISHHESRAVAKRSELSLMRDNLKKVKDDMDKIGIKRPATNVSGGFNPDYVVGEHQRLIDEHERNIKAHESLRDKFRFMNSHLFDGEYCLSELDLIKIEMIVQ